jgi:class 3 adenylate cyclase/predicted ATPase
MDVGSWLQSLGLEQYEANFRDNRIDADLLPQLTADDLKDIGVSAVGDRRRLLAAIAALSSPTPSVNAPAAPPNLAPAGGLQVSAERRPITVMFCDLVGSTSLAAKLDAEDWRNLVNAYLDEASAAVTGLGGHVLKKLGDGLMALFGYPHAQENDAERAVRAALAIQRALADLNARNARSGAPELSARIGIETGPVVVDAEGEVFGEAPNVAARVQAAAEPGSVLVTGSVQRQVAGLFVVEEKGAHELKGVAQPLSLYRVVRASGGGRRGGMRALTQFVGREEELGLLARRWERARAGEGQLVLIVGEPGLGKSRLIEEFHTRLAETPHTWVEWSASQLLQNTPLHPIVEWGRQRFGVDAPPEQRLADLEGTLRLIGLDHAEYAPLVAPLVDIPLPPDRAAHFPPEELRRRQLAAMTAWVLAGARSQPVVLAIEDLHWADPTSLDLLRTFADRGAQAPLLVLATTRPEFRAPWSLRSHHSSISLSPLNRAGVALMVGEISARHALSKELIEGVNERTGGVPLFVEEVTRLLVERGEQGGVQAIPPTLQVSLAARLDRLGPAREVAQIGAVLGRDFTYSLLRDLAGLDESALHPALERLTEADLLFVEGAPPQAKFRFKHALIQDAAYDSLLKSRRQALHRRAAEILCDQPEHAAEPEAIAHHFTQAGLDDLAIEWWGKAGDQALRRSAFAEAISHLGKAIELSDKAGEAARPREAAASASASQRLKLQTDYGHAVMWSKGYVAEETKAAFACVGELAKDMGNAEAPFDAHYARWIRCVTRGELGSARETAESFLREAEREGRLTEAGVAHRMSGLTLLYQGDFEQARAHLERALRIYDPERDREAKFRFGTDSRVLATSYLAFAAWCFGDVAPARELIDEAGARAVQSAHAPTLTTTYFWQATLEVLRGDAEAALRAAEAVMAISREHGLALYLAGGALSFAWARAKLGDWDAGLAEFRQAVAQWAGQGNKVQLPFYRGLLAEIEADGGGAEAALAEIEKALTLAGETGEHWFDAGLHRIRGEILLKQNPADPAPAEAAFLAANAVAKQQGARIFELLAALSLAKLYRANSRPADAHAILAQALEGFSPAAEMPEIAEAQALLAALAEMEQVKSAEGQRQRRLHLQTTYGQALMLSKGFAAEETKDAFARARGLAGGKENPAERFPAYFAQWVRSLARGEHRRAQRVAETFLREAEEGGYATEAGFARRCLGTSCCYQGKLLEAQTHLERALADYQPDRDAQTRFRFGFDTRILATAHLVITTWHLGQVERARQLADQAVQSATELGHVPSGAVAHVFKTGLEVLRNDPGAALRSAETLLALVREHGMEFYVAVGEAYAGWARGRLGDPQAGAQVIRRALAEQFNETNRINAPLFHGLLAELEAVTRGPDAALTLIDQGLAAAQETGEHYTDPYLHRLRGEVLFRRDPDNPVPAEEAFQTAIAIAKQQGARSHGLRAAVSLAKRYQSTSRLAEAQAVLAPALEGFAPTPEMPEIAEALALLVAIESARI